MDNRKGDKMKKLPPIIISIIAIGYFSIYIALFFFVDETEAMGKLFLIIFGIVGVSLIGGMIYTLFVRLKEIDKEEHDDLSKY